MTTIRVCAMAYCLLAAISCVRASVQVARPLPPARFQGWADLQQTRAVDRLLQVWRQSLAGLPDGSEGYAMLSYEAKFTTSREVATNLARGQLQVKRFNDYVRRGYTVEAVPWSCQGNTGAVFLIRGIDKDAARSAHRADIYALAFSREEWVVWVELRVAVSATTPEIAEHAIRHVAGQQLAGDIAGLVIDLWLTTRNTDAVTPFVPVVAPPPATPAAPEEAAPTAPVETPAAAPEETPTAAPPAVQEDVAPPAPPAPPVEPETPAPPAETPPAEDRWKTADGRLSLVLPPGWRVSGETPYLITGLPDVTIRLFPSEPYASEEELPSLLESFVAIQRSISVRHFKSTPVTMDGARGVEVRYTNVRKRTSLLYLFGKSQRLWQLEIDLPRQNAATPAALARLLQSLRVE